MAGSDGRSCVVVSNWVGHPIGHLKRLLAQMGRIDAGCPYDLVIVCNGGDRRPLAPRLPRLPRGARVIDRPNQGYNLGAWDAGWRASPGYEHYLFLQDECVLRRPGWLAGFVFRARHDDRIGLLGESMMWEGASWDFVKRSTARDLGPDWYRPRPSDPIDAYREALVRRGVPPGELAQHLQSLVLFATGEALRRIDGIPSADASYDAAVGCEIAITKMVEAAGFRAAKVRDDRFHYVAHRQWTARERLLRRVRNSLRTALRPRRAPRPATP